jgi:hypothetical protein
MLNAFFSRRAACRARHGGRKARKARKARKPKPALCGTEVPRRPPLWFLGHRVTASPRLGKTNAQRATGAWGPYLARLLTHRPIDPRHMGAAGRAKPPVAFI